jgi:NADH:ubiquinone oxidoreductase subunit 2 (subunit N)
MNSSHTRLMTALFILGMLSLAGIPPLPGFWGKIFLVTYVIKANHTLSALVVFISSFIGIYPYFKMIGRLGFKSLGNTFSRSIKNSGLKTFVFLRSSYLLIGRHFFT